jgi:hypothetical protein
VVRVTSTPRRILLRAAFAVTILLLVPDVMLFPNNPTGPVVTLMAMHVAIAIITAALLTIAPAKVQGNNEAP